MGSGTVNGSINTSAGTGIYGGTDGTYGTNTFASNLTLATGAAAYFDLGTTATGSNDEIVVNGTLTLNGNAIHVKAPGPSAFLGFNNYTLFSSSNLISVVSPPALVWDVAPANAAKYTLVVVGNTVILQYASSPGPFILTTSASPNPAYPNESVLIGASVSTNGSTLNTITVDASQIAGTAPGTTIVTLVSAGTANPTLYTNSVNVGASVPIGTVSYNFTATDNASINGYATNTLNIISGAPTITATASPNPVGLSQVVTISATVLGNSYPIGANGVSVDVSAIAGTSPGTTIVTLYPSATANVYTNSYTVLNTTAYGPQTLPVSAVNSGLETGTGSLVLTVSPLDVWTGLGGDNNWTTGNNWLSGLTPGAGDFVTFAGTRQVGTDMNNNYSLGAVTYDKTAGAFNLSDPTASYTLTLKGGLTNNSANVQTVSVPVALGGTQTFNAASNSVVVNNVINDDTADGLLGGVVKTGTNTLTLTGNNGYSGPTVVSAGQLILSGFYVGSGGSVTNGAVLQLANVNAVSSSTSVLALNNGSTLQLRADSGNTFAPQSLLMQNASDNLTFDVGPVTAGVTGQQLILSGTLAFGNSSDQTINVTGNSTYSLSLGAITLNTGSHTPYFNVNLNTLPGGPSVTIASITVGNWGNDINMNGGGRVTVAGNLSNTSNGALNLFVNNNTTVTLQGVSVKANTGDAFKYDVANGTLVLDNGYALTNYPGGAGLGQGLFVIGAATNIFYGAGYTHSFGVLTTNNNSYNAAVYLGDANNAGGGLSTAANLTNNVSDGDVTFTNSGVFTIGGQNTGGINTYANPIILGWTANRGKSVTLVAAGGGEVDFNGNILANGTDTTAGVTVGDPAHNGVVKFAGTNTYAGPTTVSNGTLVVNGINGASPVTVTAGTILGGSGTIGGAVTVNSGGHTLPGGTQGNASGVVLTLSSNATYNAGGEADFNLSGTYNSGNDQLVVTNGGTVNGNGQNVGVYLTAGSADTTGDYVLITNVSGSLASSFARVPVWLGATPGNAANYSILTSGKSVVLHYSPIIIASGSALPSPAIHGQHVTVSVNVTSTAGTISSVSLNAGAIGGSSSLTLTEVGATSVYTGNVVVSSTTPVGVQTLLVTAKDSGGNTNTVPVLLTIVGTGEVWTGNASPNNTWAAGGNWVSGAGPGPGDWATFAGTQQLTANMESSYSLAWLTFDVTAGAFTITNAANTLTLTGSVTNNSANVETLGVPVVLGGVETINAAAGSIVMNTNVSGAGGLIVAGTNILTLAGSNTYTGTTTVSTNAILQLANANAVKGGVLTLNNAATLQLRADASTTFTPGSLALQTASDMLNFDVRPLTSAAGNTLALVGAMTNGSSSDQTINVTGNSTYTLSLGAITLTATSHTPYFNLFVNTQPGGPNLTLGSVNCGQWGSVVDLNGGGKVTVTGGFSVVPSGGVVLFVNNGTTATLQGSTTNATGTSDGFKYDVVNGTLVLDNSSALTNNTSGAGLPQSLFVLGAATNLFYGAAYSQEFGVLTTNNNSYNAAVYLGDANNAGGGLSTAANLTNNVSDGDVTFTNSGVFTIGGQNTGGINTYANPIILGWTANRGKSVTLVAATGGEVDFTGGIRANGTDTTAGITVGDAAHGGTVKLRGTANTYAGPTTVSNGTLIVSGTIGNGAVTVDGGTLGGSGTLGGAVTVQAGGTIQPGAGAGAAGSVLTINNSLTLNSGSATLLAVSHNNHTNDQISYQAIVYGGTLTVTTNAGDGPLVAGDTFQLFKASLSFYSGSFSATNLPALGAGLGWSNSFAANGSITVVASAASGAPVTISGGAISGGMFVISGTNGVPGAQYRILETTNAALAITNWTPVWTNVFGAGGSFSYTNTPGVNPAGFFLLVSP
jgi:autotransporter-associated beta strand protein